MVDPLVDFLFVVQHNKRFGGDGIAIKDETEVSTLTFHIRKVYQGCIQPTPTNYSKERKTKVSERTLQQKTAE